MLKTDIERTKSIIEEADAILITSQVGRGVHSGVPDFKENEEFWNDYPVMKKLGLDFKDMDDRKFFTVNPEQAWAFYGHRLHLCRDKTPHCGFKLLLDLVEEKDLNYFIYTSYVDGVFQKAGFDKEKILELHGSIYYVNCSGKCKGVNRADTIELDIDMQHFKAGNIPMCSKCGNLLRPNILMSNDWDWDSLRRHKQFIRYAMWMKDVKHSKQNLVIIELADGKDMPMVRLDSKNICKKLETRMIRINLKDYCLHRLYYCNLHFPYGGLEDANGLQ